MSFRQDRTNPSTAVSNWRGRSNTPKAWPSTRTSTWMNGGLFGAAASGATMEFIAQVVADNTSAVASFTSVPQTYRSLRIVMASGRRATYADKFGLNFNSDTTAGNYGWNVLYNTGASSTYSTSQGANDGPYGDNPTGSGSSYSIIDIVNYSDAAVCTSAQFQMGSYTSSPTGIIGYAYEVASAVTAIDVVSDTLTSDYYFIAPTVFTLFGIGTAD